METQFGLGVLYIKQIHLTDFKDWFTLLFSDESDKNKLEKHTHTRERKTESTCCDSRQNGETHSEETLEGVVSRDEEPEDLTVSLRLWRRWSRRRSLLLRSCRVYSSLSRNLMRGKTTNKSTKYLCDFN
jgi:hypothetical protein